MNRITVITLSLFISSWIGGRDQGGTSLPMFNTRGLAKAPEILHKISSDRNCTFQISNAPRKSEAL